MKKYLIITIAFFISTCLSSQDLQLITPNGGEVLNAGSETEITWEGVSEDEIVKLEFSSDNGETWEEITRNTTGNKYKWDAPYVSSDKCLIRINKFENNSIKESEIKWEKSYGGTHWDEAFSLKQTMDGGYIVVGLSLSSDGDITNPKGNWDYWIIKLKQNGEIEWEKSLGGSHQDWANSVQQTDDGGYIVAGWSRSVDGDITNPKGGSDYWIIKLNSYGEIEWEKSFGSSGSDEANSIQQTDDGGYIVVGWSRSIDGDITDPKGGSDYWIIKLNSYGEIEWEKSLGGSKNDEANSIQQTDDGGYIVAGWSKSIDEDASKNKGGTDYWIIKLNSYGDLEWEKSYGGTGDDKATEIKQTIDGGYIVAGWSSSKDGDITDSKSLKNYWVIKLNSYGDLEWEKTYGGSEWEEAHSTQETLDGGFIIAGVSGSKDGDIKESKGLSDIWIIKLNSYGDLEWEKSYGGSGKDNAHSIQETLDGGFIIAGVSNSLDGDRTEPLNHLDYWLVKLTGDNLLQSDKSDAVFNINSPDLRIQNNNIDIGQVTIGKSKDTVISVLICNDGDAPLDIQGVEITRGDESDFQIKNGDEEFTLDENECEGFIFEFTPKVVGERIAYATVKATIGDFRKTIRIMGEGIIATSVKSEDKQTLNNVNLKIKPNFTANNSFIEFETSKAGNVKLEIYNSTGTKIQTILNEVLYPGRREMTLDLSDFATGRYYIQLSTPTVTKTEILEVVK